MEQKISNIKDTRKKMDILKKENAKYKKSLTQNSQEIWDTMKIPNLKIIDKTG